MPSLRKRASRAPRTLLATAASAAFRSRSLSAALKRRRGFGATVSTAAPLVLRAFCAAAVPGVSGAWSGFGFGMFTGPGSPFGTKISSGACLTHYWHRGLPLFTIATASALRFVVTGQSWRTTIPLSSRWVLLGLAAYMVG